MARTTTWALVVLWTCGCGNQRPGFSHSGLAVSGDRSTIVYAVEDGLVQQRAHSKRKVAFSGCFSQVPDELSVSARGERAIVLSWQSLGGSIHHHVEHGLSQACVVNLDSGTTSPLETAFPKLYIPDAPEAGHELHFGSHSDWLYTFSWFHEREPLFDVIGPDGAAQRLPAKLEGDRCSLAEAGHEITAACAEYEEISSGTYTYRIAIARMNASTFPPTLTERFDVDVPNAHTAILSPGGGTALWWHQALSGPTMHAGLINVKSKTSTPLSVMGQLEDADFSMDGREAVLIERGTDPSRGTARHLRVVDVDSASNATNQRRISIGTRDVAAVYWLADNRILVVGFGWARFIVPPL